jgi:hypothetical protein
MRLLPIVCLLLPVTALGQDWKPTHCGPAPVAPHLGLGTRDGYTNGLAKETAYRQAAQAYASCMLNEAHATETEISRVAQDKIASVQAAAVARQQEIYAMLRDQAEEFRQAAAKLNGPR